MRIVGRIVVFSHKRRQRSAQVGSLNGKPMGASTRAPGLQRSDCLPQDQAFGYSKDLDLTKDRQWLQDHMIV